MSVQSCLQVCSEKDVVRDLYFAEVKTELGEPKLLRCYFRINGARDTREAVKIAVELEPDFKEWFFMDLQKDWWIADARAKYQGA